MKLPSTDTAMSDKIVGIWSEVITICDNLPEKAKFSPVAPFAGRNVIRLFK